MKFSNHIEPVTSIQKTILKNAAKIYAANLIRNSMGTGAAFFNTELTLEDVAYFQMELDRISHRLSEHNSSSLEQSLEIAHNLYFKKPIINNL